LLVPKKAVMDEYVTKSPQETFLLGKSIGADLPKGAVLAFFGDLGAGKTQFIKGVVEAATAPQNHNVTSPTFVYLNIYDGATTVHHFDLYRLEDPEQFLTMGFDEYLDDEAITCIEWAENIESIIPPDAWQITLEHLEKESRKVTVRGQR